MTENQQIESLIPEFLRNSEKFYVTGIDFEGRYIYANSRFLNQFEKKGDPYIGKVYLQTIHPDDLPGCIIAAQQCIANPGKCFSVSLRKPDQNGEYFWTDWEFTLLADDTAQHIGIMCVGLDVTSTKNTEFAMREHERKLVNVVNNLSEIYSTSDLQFNNTFVSSAVERVLGFTAQHAMLMPPEKRFPPETLRLFSKIIKEELSRDTEPGVDKNRIKELEAKAFHADGSIKDVLVRVSFTRNELGHPTGIQSFTQDITAEKERQKELLRTTERYLEVAANSSTVVWEIDPLGIFTYVNEVVKTSYGLKPSDIIGKKYYHDLCNESKRKSFKKWFFALLKKHASWEGVEKEICDAKGNVRIMLTSGAPYFDGSGNLVGYRGISIDITDRKRMEDALRKSEQQMRELLDEKEKVMRAQSLLASIARRYINIPLSQVKGSIQNSLAEIGHFTSAHRVFIFRYDWESMQAFNTYEWCRTGVESWQDRLQHVPMENYMRWLKAHKKGEAIEVVNLSDIDPTSAEYEVLTEQNVKSLYSYPLMSDHHCLGCVGIETSRGDTSFDWNARLLVKVFAELLVNVQQRARADDELLHARIMLEQAGQMAKVGAFEIDFKTGIRYWSKVCYDIHELEVGTPPNGEESIAFYKDEEARASVREIIKRAKTDPKYKMDYTLPIITAKGNERHLRILAKTEFEGTVCTKIYGTAQDVTEERMHRLEQERLLQLTQNQNERLRNFAHIVAHNLKSHSGNLESLLELITQSNPELAELDMMLMLKRVSSNLKDTLSHLSEVALLRSTEKEALTPVALDEILRKAIENSTALAKDVELRNMVSSGLKVRGIPAYLDSIFLNLLSNAVKYRRSTDTCVIELTSQEDNRFVTISVKDNGQGINLEQHGKKLFGMYKTFHNHPDARGLGLFITKNQIESMGGRIEVESEVGIGTTFHVMFSKH